MYFFGLSKDYCVIGSWRHVPLNYKLYFTDTLKSNLKSNFKRTKSNLFLEFKQTSPKAFYFQN